MVIEDLWMQNSEDQRDSVLCLWLDPEGGFFLPAKP